MRTKKPLALLTALLLALSMTLLPAHAAAPGGSITVENAVAGQTYRVYQVFLLDSYDAAAQAYIYKVNANSDWETFAKTSEAAAYITVDELGYVSWKGDATAARSAEFAKLALDYAKAHSVAADGELTAGEEPLRFDGLALGYYLVDSSLGALCALTTTQPAATVREKNDAPSIDKEVQEKETFGPRSDAQVGDLVTFRTTITAQPGAEGYVLHDRMSAGLTFREITAVTRGGNAISPNLYTLTTTGLNDDCTFELAFAQSFCDTLTAGETLQVTYTAEVNAGAVVAGTGNPNDSWLDYGDNNHTATVTTRTYVWDFKVFKYTERPEGDGSETVQVPLSGAQFVLRNKQGQYLTAEAITGEDGALSYRLTGWTGSEWDDETEGAVKATLLITPDSGLITITGLDSGSYTLEEITAPAGYSLLKDPVHIALTPSYQETDAGSAALSYGVGDDPKAEADRVEVLNLSGHALPSTGGMGTRVFYLAGGLLTCLTGTLLLTRKRLHRAD